MKSKTKCRVYRSYMRTRGVAVSDYFYKELPCLVFQIVQDLWYEFNINHWLLCDSFDLQRISKINVSLFFFYFLPFPQQQLPFLLVLYHIWKEKAK